MHKPQHPGTRGLRPGSMHPAMRLALVLVLACVKGSRATTPTTTPTLTPSTTSTKTTVTTTTKTTVTVVPDYDDPYLKDCPNGQKVASIDNAKGVFCAPACDGQAANKDTTCPTWFPPGKKMTPVVHFLICTCAHQFIALLTSWRVRACRGACFALPQGPHVGASGCGQHGRGQSSVQIRRCVEKRAQAIYFQSPWGVGNHPDTGNQSSNADQGTGLPSIYFLLLSLNSTWMCSERSLVVLILSPACGSVHVVA